MKRYLIPLLALFLAMTAAACANKPAPTATAMAASVTVEVPTELAVEPLPETPTVAPATAVPTALPETTGDIMTLDEDGNTAIDLALLDGALNQLDSATLNDDEVADLLFMREEEKLAHDVYLVLYAQWGLPIFQNIANSELTHTEAIAELLIRYDLDDPALDQAAGVFTNDDLQALYDQLISQGSQSLTAALQVGATIEDLDIVDLQDAVAQTDNADIILVYENLMKGSRNHLRSFISTLQKQNGETYQPQYLNQDAYEAIINSPMERGP